MFCTCVLVLRHQSGISSASPSLTSGLRPTFAHRVSTLLFPTLMARTRPRSGPAFASSRRLASYVGLCSAEQNPHGSAVLRTASCWAGRLQAPCNYAGALLRTYKPCGVLRNPTWLCSALSRALLNRAPAGALLTCALLRACDPCRFCSAEQNPHGSAVRCNALLLRRTPSGALHRAELKAQLCCTGRL